MVHGGIWKAATSKRRSGHGPPATEPARRNEPGMASVIGRMAPIGPLDAKFPRVLWSKRPVMRTPPSFAPG